MHKRILLAALLAAAAVVRPAHATLTSTCSSSTQVGNGSTTAFTFPCKFLQNGDISVTVNGVAKTQPGDYTVSGAGNASGTITFGAAPASGAMVVITRTVDLKQSTSLRQNRSLDPATVETTLDKLTMQVQQVDAKAPTGSGGVATQAYVDAAIAATLTGGLVVQPVSWSLTGDGVTTAFSIPNAAVNAPDLYIVTIDGVYQKPATDYTVSVATAQITFASAPALNAAIAVRSFGYARALSVGDSTSVLATGTTVPRMLKDWTADGINVKGCGATGDGSTNDTALVQACVTVANAAGKALLFPPGTYSVSNLTAGTTPWFGVPRQSIIKARNSGDAGYLVASSQWLAAGSVSASNPWKVDGLDFDANGFKTYGVVVRAFFTKFYNCQFKGSTDTDLLFSTDARDGTLLSSTMVNNEVRHSWIGVDGSTAQYGIRTIDTNGKATDYMIVGNYFSGASVVNLWAQLSSGWVVAENHFYGTGPSSVYLYKPNIGTIYANNYSEKEVRFGSPNTSATTPVTYGPGNFFSTHVWADFNNTGNLIVSTGNTYSTTAELRHAYFDPSKVLVSQGDTFGNATPFKHYASAGGAAQDASTGKFQVINAAIPGTATVTALFDGSASGAAGIMHRQASWAHPGFQSGIGWTAFANLGTPVNSLLLYCYDCTIANPCAGRRNGRHRQALERSVGMQLKTILAALLRRPPGPRGDESPQLPGFRGTGQHPRPRGEVRWRDRLRACHPHRHRRRRHRWNGAHSGLLEHIPAQLVRRGTQHLRRDDVLSLERADHRGFARGPAQGRDRNPEHQPARQWRHRLLRATRRTTSRSGASEST
jgi:hypothetical protein